MKKIFFASIVISLAMLTVLSVSVQALNFGASTERIVAEINNITFSGGSAQILESIPVTISICNSEPGCLYGENLENLYFEVIPSDSGKILVATPENNADFTDFVALITDGIDGDVGITVSGSFVGSRESEFFGTQTGPNGIDLEGSNITHISLFVKSATLDVPGSDPNGNGNWTDYHLESSWLFLEAVVEDQVLDDFNRADGPIGGNWTRYTSKYRIWNNQLRVRSSGSNTDIYWHEEFGADQEAFFTFAQINETATEQDLLLKSQSKHTWGDGVIEVLYDAPGHNVQVWTWEWPQGWVKYGDDIPVTFMVGDTFKARARADGIVEVYRNGTLLGTRDVTSWSHYDKGGYIGLWFIGARNTIIDDFGGGTVSDGTTP